MLKYFRNSFTFKGVFKNTESKLSVSIIYFLLIILVISFPLNYQYITKGIQNVNNITLGMRENIPAWFPDDLPEIIISKEGMVVPTGQTYLFKATLGDKSEFSIIFNPQESTVIPNSSLVFYEHDLIYIDSNGRKLTSDYHLMKKSISFSDFNDPFLYNETSSLDTFLQIIDDAFGNFFILYFVVFNTFQNLFLNLMLIVISALIFLLIRVKYKKVTTYLGNIKMLVSCMTIPAIVSLIMGLFNVMELNSFTVVLFQFMTPLIGIGAIYLGGKEKDISTKGL